MASPTLIIDGYGFVFRAFHVQPPLTSPSGLQVGALYGFTSMLLKVLNDFKPTNAVIVFDAPGKNFRHSLYNEYKAHRPPTPEELRSQLPLVRLAAEALNFNILEQAGVEADDVIASLASQLSSAGKKSIIISSDKDLMQLISDDVIFYDPMKSKYIKEAEVFEKFGVLPDKVRDVLSLIGDKSDNVPGVPSIGPKTAAELIGKFGSLHQLLEGVNEIPQEKRRQAIESNKENALLSWDLVGLKKDLDIDITKITWSLPKRDKLVNFIVEYGFKSLIPRAERLFGIDLEPIKQPTQQSFNLGGPLDGNIDHIISSARQSGSLAIYLSSDEFLLATKDNAVASIKLNDPSIDKVFTLLRDQSVTKLTVNLKSMLKIIAKENIDFHSFEDLALMHYATSAGLPQPPYDFWLIPGIHSFFAKYDELKAKLRENKAFSIYYDIDLPLTFLLYEMEREGILIDKNILELMSADFVTEIKTLEERIFELSDCEFNIASPKQLGEVLFEKLKLPGGKISSKAKTFATGIEILEHLSESGYEIADHLIRWRALTKLKNTYIDTLPKQINKLTGRVHTTFIQNTTSTGRLSSQDPNLQNIPIKSVEGAKIRKAFIAKPGYLLIAADYSQIELRILSKIANIETMQEAFRNNIDIHHATAKQIFKTEITPDLRRRAKAINFGIIYGISAFGLAKQLGITRQEAANYITSYFAEYPGIEKYMNKTKLSAHANGYVENILDRKCFLPNINNSNFMNRSFSERAAINAPIQGSAADIAKLAMIASSKALQEHNIEASMLLQIHDELIFEVSEKDAPNATMIIKQAMENVINLDIPMVVDIKSAKNWGDTK